jgi:hypothetical protein
MIHRIALGAQAIVALIVLGGCDISKATNPSVSASVSTSRNATRDDNDRESSSGSRTIHLAKECSEYAGNVGDHCTITKSNVDQIPIHSRVFYLAPADIEKGTYNGDVELRVTNGDVAFGHCVVFDLFSTTDKAVIGNCSFLGGSGQFKTFRATIVVSLDLRKAPLGAVWDGKYSFSTSAEED